MKLMFANILLFPAMLYVAEFSRIGIFLCIFQFLIVIAAGLMLLLSRYGGISVGKNTKLLVAAYILLWAAGSALESGTMAYMVVLRVVELATLVGFVMVVRLMWLRARLGDKN